LNNYFYIFSFIILILFTSFFKYYLIDQNIIHELNLIKHYLFFGNQLEFGWFDVRIVGWMNFFRDLNLINLIFGYGFMSIEQIFHDSFLIFLYSSVGFFGIFLIIIFTKKIYDKNFFDNTNFVIFLICVIGSNLFISEFILISRYSFMVVLMIVIYYRKFHITYKNIKKLKASDKK